MSINNFLLDMEYPRIQLIHDNLFNNKMEDDIYFIINHTAEDCSSQAKL